MLLLLLLQLLLWAPEAALGRLLFGDVSVDLELSTLLFDCCNWCGGAQLQQLQQLQQPRLLAEDSSCFTKIGFFCKFFENQLNGSVATSNKNTEKTLISQ